MSLSSMRAAAAVALVTFIGVAPVAAQVFFRTGTPKLVRSLEEARTVRDRHDEVRIEFHRIFNDKNRAQEYRQIFEELAKKKGIVSLEIRSYYRNADAKGEGIGRLPSFPSLRRLSLHTNVPRKGEYMWDAIAETKRLETIYFNFC